MKKRREDSFFGMHFDFHATEQLKNIGADANIEQLGRFLDLVKPDFIECDTKGHYGYSTYFTDVGVRAPHLSIDIAAMWRKLTADRDIALYAHHSSLWEEYSAIEHPEWAIVDENGVVSRKYLSLFSPYIEERLIPQLIELATKYEFDGVWIDGDNWCLVPDYSQNAQKVYFEKYGKKIPKSTEEDYPLYLDFLRDAFCEYVKKYCDAVHKIAPNFQIGSSSLYSPNFPEIEKLPVDYVSVDVVGHRSKLVPRLFAQSGYAWDMMDYGFKTPNFTLGVSDDMQVYIPEVVQMCQSAANTISSGGTYQFNFYPIVAKVYEWAIPKVVQLADFCRAREDFCFKAKFVPQAAVYYSSKAYYVSKTQDFYDKERVYPHFADFMWESNTILSLMLDNQYSTEVLLSDKISNGNVNNYGLIAVPNMEVIEDDSKNNLLNYAKNGGNLLLFGANTVSLFAEDLKVEIFEKVKDKNCYISYDNAAVCARGDYVKINGNYQSLGKFYLNNYLLGDSYDSACVINYGKGKIGLIPFSVLCYNKMPTALMRRFIGYVVNKLWNNPTVKVTGSSFLHVSLMKKDEKLCVNLLNTLGGYRYQPEFDTMTVDEIPALYDITVEIVCENKPNEVWLEPEHKPINYIYENGKILLTLDKIDIHSIIVVE